MTGARNAAAFVSGVLTLVACGGGAATQPMPTAQRNVCEVRFVSPPGFERTDTFEEPYPDRIGLRLGFRDEAGRELHAFAGIPGEFGEGLPDAGTVELVGGRTGRLAGGPHRVWVLTWDEGGMCDPRAVLGRGFDQREFLDLLALAGVARMGEISLPKGSSTTTTVGRGVSGSASHERARPDRRRSGRRC